jgi:hypothetical protein
MFEDDDYCIRAKKAGFTLAVVEDCFVYHKGSMSFSKLGAESYRGLFEKNKAYFREKHGLEWTLTEIAFSYWEKFDLDFQSHINKLKKVSSEIERIIVRYENFKHLLVQIQQIELASAPTNIRAASTHRVATVTKWKLRKRNFQRNFIQGNAATRWRYVRLLLRKVSHRLGFNHNSNFTLTDEQDTELTQSARAVIGKLKAIKDGLEGRKLVVFPSTIDFHYMTQRPQHLARAFTAAGYVVIYGTQNHQEDKVDIIEQVADNLYLLNEPYFIFLGHAFHPEEVIYYCLWPNNVKHLSYLPYSYLLYDYMDELSLLDLPQDELERDHQYILNQADLVTVSADRLMAQLPVHILPKTLLVNNAVSREFFDAVNVHDLVSGSLTSTGKRPILGYYGAIAEWVDFDLIEYLAEELPDTRIVLIGPIAEVVSKRVSETLWRHSNIVVLPTCKQLELIPYIKRFDVCLIPFVKNAVTDAVSPVKLFEYFSAGKQVVTTNLVECAKYSLVNIAKDHRQFVDFVRNILLCDSMKLDEAARQFASENTWDHRVQHIISSMMQLKDAMPETASNHKDLNELAVDLPTHHK